MGGVPSGSSSQDQSSLSDAIRDAAASGVSVIVIDSNGNLITTGGAAKPADGEEEETAASAMMRAQEEVEEFEAALQQRLDALPTSVAAVKQVLRDKSPTGEIFTYVEILLWTSLFLGIAYFAMREIYGKRLVRGFMISQIRDNPQGYIEKMPFLLLRFSAGVVGTIFGIIVAYIIGAILFGVQDEVTVDLTVTAIFAAFFAIRVISDLWRMILSPFLSQYRIPHLNDRDAKKLFRWIWVLTTFDIITVIFSAWIGDFGLNYNVYALIYGSLSLAGAALNVLLVLFNARAISNAIRGGKGPAEVAWVVRFLSFAWAPVVIGYVSFAWLKLAFDLVLEQNTSIPPIAALYGVVLSIVVVYGIFNYIIERYFDRSREVQRINEAMAEADAAEEDDYPEFAELPGERRTYSINSYEDLARRVAGIIAFVTGVIALLAIWDPESSILRASLVDRAIDVIFIVFIGYILFHFFRIWIDSKISEEEPDAEGELGDEGGATGASRLATLLPLFRGAILATVVVAIALIALMEIGINVSPLFAGAGVVGLAVGFGAQTLVRDIFSGAFFLIDDAFRKGEYIDIGDVKGTVEKISVRSFQLRHHLGALNTIPFGEIKVLTNYSRDWVIMKLPLRVTYDTDVEKVRKLIKNLGKDLLKDPVIGENFIQPLKSQGVIEMQDSAMIIRVKFMTKPGDQWLVRKKVYEEIRRLFAIEGIRFAHREVTVRLADEQVDELTPKQKDAVLGAAQAAIIEDDLDGDGMPDDR
ncbi:MAG: mechanosensitive ion channel family protein [Paracoccaceae bacterium]